MRVHGAPIDGAGVPVRVPGVRAPLRDEPVLVAGAEVGRVADVIHLPEQDMLEIRTEAGPRLVPFVRALVPEVMVDGDRFAVVADRVEPETLIAAERVPEWLKQ